MLDRIIDTLCDTKIDIEPDGESFPDGSVIDQTKIIITMSPFIADQFAELLGFADFRLLLVEIRERNNREYKS